MKTTAIIGAGASGMMAGVSALANTGARVLVFERNEKTGKKLYLTGKGRCNITNLCDVADILAHIPSNPFFLYSALSRMDSRKLIEFFNSIGLMTKVERGGRVFPLSDKSSDVISALNNKLAGARAFFNTRVCEIKTINGAVTGVITEKGEFHKADNVIIATGGLSYPKTGSTGDGYKLAADLGHNIIECYPSLMGLLTNERDIHSLQGLTLKNTGVCACLFEKTVYTGFGEVLFTHNGLSGPVILSASRFLTRRLKKACVHLDLKPALDKDTLDNRILRDFNENKNKNLNKSLYRLLPGRMIDIIIRRAGLDPDKKVNEITRAERGRLVCTLKDFTINITAAEGFDRAVITCGGVDTRSVNPSTMESKLIKGLYFAGEVLDVDAFTGGYNLQIAFSTGYLAGMTL